MTAYADRTDLARLGVAAAALDGIEVEAQEAALDAASAVADSYLRQRFTLPLTAWGDDLTDAVCAIAAFRAASNVGFNPAAGGNEALKNRHDQAIAWLRDIATGKASPGVTDSSTEAGSADPAEPEVYTSPLRGW